MTNKFQKIKARILHASGGFTLIETLVAVLLLAAAISGPLTIASKGLSSSLVAKDQIGAFYLAQDAMEYLRFKRDSNTLADASWLTGIVGSGLCSTNGVTTCRVDTVQDTVTACSGTCPALNYNTATRYFTYSAVGGSVVATPQRYVRTVQVVAPVGSNANEASITVTVSWVGAGGITRNIIIRENLLDWQ